MKVLSFYPVNRPDKTYIVPEGVEIIDKYAFTNTKHLERIIIPESVRYIQYHAFENANLHKIEIAKGLKYIGACAFLCCFDRNCVEKFVSLPESVQEIEFNALTGIPHIECHEGTAKGLIRALYWEFFNKKESKHHSVLITIIRKNGSRFDIHLAESFSKDGLKKLDEIWDNPELNDIEKQECFEYFYDTMDRYQFAFDMCRTFGESSACMSYLKRIASRFAQALVDDNQIEELIELLRIKDALSIKSLHSLLKYVANKNMTTVSAYILNILSHRDEGREILRL